jgi:2'-5' RNA ligase
MDALAQARFDRLREQYFPPERNFIQAHLTLFHTLPETEAVRIALTEVAGSTPEFEARVSGVRSLGRGVAYAVESAELMRVHRDLSRQFADVLTAQDRQGFRPHVVVQNKVSGHEAKALLGELSAGFSPFVVMGLGLDLWRYLGGPWEFVEGLRFRQ